MLLALRDISGFGHQYTFEAVWCDPLCLPAAVVCRLITDLLCRRRTGVMGHDDVCVCPVLERAKAKVAKVEEA